MCRWYGTWVIFGGFLGASIGGGTEWEDIIPFGMEPEGAHVASLGNYNGLRGRIQLYLMFNNIWGSGVK